jgi:hypothetical protein
MLNVRRYEKQVLNYDYFMELIMDGNQLKIIVKVKRQQNVACIDSGTDHKDTFYVFSLFKKYLLCTSEKRKKFVKVASERIYFF